MMVRDQTSVRIAIACGGTGGHFFPGLAVAEQLASRGCRVTLLTSAKDVDQQAVKAVAGMEVVALPAVGLKRGGEIAFLRGCTRSYRALLGLFRERPPQAALAMGGFTSAPVILAARRTGARTFLHESNTVPGRANRWLSWVVDCSFVGFPSAATRLHARKVTVTGTPVRSQFKQREPAVCRAALGLEPGLPVIVVMGGSQGASGINEMVIKSLPLLAQDAPEMQWFHLAGPDDAGRVKRAYEALKLKAIVHPFFAGMDVVLGAATAVVSRAGASSLAELAAMRVPTVLIPYPAATDNHQFYNAQAYVERGAACLLEQKHATPEKLAHLILGLSRSPAARAKMQSALAQWHTPRAAEEIAKAMLVGFERPEFAEMEPMTGREPGPSSSPKPILAGRGDTVDGGLRRTDVSQGRVVAA